MKIIVFGATGGLGKHVSRTALEAGHNLTLFVRTPAKLEADTQGHAAVRVVQGDVMDAAAVRAAADGSQVAINCTSPAGGNGAEEMVRSLVPAAATAGVQAFYLVGGLGALWAPGTERTVLVQDWDDSEAMARHGLSAKLPREVLQRMTQGHLASMAYMKTTGHAHTYICPGSMVEGAASERRIVTLDELGGPSPGRVPFADVARVIVDDLADGRLLGHRVCVSSAVAPEK